MPGQSNALFNSLTQEWQSVLEPVQEHIGSIEQFLVSEDFLPDFSNIFRALSTPIAESRVLILGQDPYPTRSHAIGLAFSVPDKTRPLPPTLRNIIKEVASDVGTVISSEGDLSHWHDQGVILLNRVLTVRAGESNSHANIGWQRITDEIVKELARRGVVSLLWGKSAQETAIHLNLDLTITGVHPSPLSAYRGFFGSKPFSRTNQLLRAQGWKEITW